MDVKFLTFIGDRGQKVRRFQYTAIDDATRVRALKVYKRHTQANAIDFVDHIIEKFPFRIREIRTDNGHEFQAKFHWHVEDKGIRHAYIKPSSPQLNGKVERSHRSDQQEFYQLLSYKDRSEEHTSEPQLRRNLVCRLLLEKKKTTYTRLLGVINTRRDLLSR